MKGVALVLVSYNCCKTLLVCNNCHWGTGSCPGMLSHLRLTSSWLSMTIMPTTRISWCPYSSLRVSCIFLSLEEWENGQLRFAYLFHSHRLHRVCH